MADETPKEDRSEEASPRKLKEAQEAGDVPLSRDTIAWAGLAGALSVLVTTGPSWKSALQALLTHILETLDTTPFADLYEWVTPLGKLALMTCGAAGVAAAGTALAQTGAGFWPDRAGPDLTRLVQPSKLWRPFTRDGLADFGMAVGKMALLGIVFWFGAKTQVATGMSLYDTSPEELLSRMFAPVSSVILKAMGLLAALAAAEFAVTRHRFNTKMKMSKAEAKQDRKAEDGDPMMRGRRRRKHRELSRSRTVKAVPRADAVIVNPTHVAVAIRYRKDEGKAPKVIAKGKGQLAEIIRDIARSNGIPIVEDIPLARLLYKRVKVGGRIPVETYKAVAAVLAFVYRVTRVRPG